MNKICLYAICKNEEKNFQRWIDTYSGKVDLIIVLDTGSEDSTVDLLKEAVKEGKITKYETMKFEPMNFAKARNYCLFLALNHIIKIREPEDDWVFLSMDFDEFIRYNGIDIIRKYWNHNTMDTISLHGHTDGEDERIAKHKVHGYNVYWERSIHEIITIDHKQEKDWISPDFSIYYDHCQDKTKERDYYGLLLNSYDNGDRSIKTLTYICWEAVLHGDNEAILKYGEEALDVLKHNEKDEYFDDPQYEICIRRYLSTYYKNKGDYLSAVFELKKCLYLFSKGKFPELRRIYKDIAELCWAAGWKNESISYYHLCINIKEESLDSVKDKLWLENFDLYGATGDAYLYMELSNAYFYNEQYYESYLYCKKAIELDPKNEWISNNYKIIEDKLENFL